MNIKLLSIKEENIDSYISFIFANNCMPTLMQLKPSALVCFEKQYLPDDILYKRLLEKRLSHFNVQYRILYEDQKRYYVFIYNESDVNKIFVIYSNHTLLKENKYGLDEDKLDNNLENLAARFINYKKKTTNDFPHELGIILGYPIKDVEEYIKNNGENYIICGYWKVYHNVDEAVRIFDTYNRVKMIAIRHYHSSK